MANKASHATGLAGAAQPHRHVIGCEYNAGAGKYNVEVTVTASVTAIKGAEMRLMRARPNCNVIRLLIKRHFI